MRAVVQRVKKGQVDIGGSPLASIENGLVILLGIGPEDTHEKADFLAKKIAYLRIFDDGEGKMNLSVRDVGGEAIVVSQFTLMADTKKGNRPSFIKAAPPETASPMVDYFIEQLKSHGQPTSSGEFGAHMLVEIHNDGPVTILFDI
jgi:D-tyrosyl-tRNA(Tyr) deacylase